MFTTTDLHRRIDGGRHVFKGNALNFQSLIAAAEMHAHSLLKFIGEKCASLIDELLPYREIPIKRFMRVA